VRRTTLSKKLLLAALPLVVAVGALLTITVLADLDRVEEAERDADLGEVWTSLLATVSAVTAEQQVAIDGMLGVTPLNVASAVGTPDADALDQASERTDAAIAALNRALRAHPGFEQVELGQVEPAVEVGRRLGRQWTHEPGLAVAAANTPFVNYEIALRELTTVGSILQSATGNPVTGRTLLGVAQFSEGTLAGAMYNQSIAQHQLDPTDIAHLIDARAALRDMTTALDQFEVTATPEWAAAYRQSGVHALVSSPEARVNRALDGDTGALDVLGDMTSVNEAIAGTSAMQTELIAEVVDAANADAAQITRSSRVRLGVIGGAVLLATIFAFLITRSITRRIRAVARNARQVSTEQLPALVEAMRDPRGRALPAIAPVPTKGSDELTELATSFNTLQATLHEVAQQQVAVLRRGVSDIFVTMARRNRSLVDRQLSMLDEFEAEVEDPDVLASYYHLDHLATRMRRNSESLLVLANAEPRRGRVGPTDIDNVVRAAIGEIEEYRRIQVQELDHLKVRGNVVADIAHLLAELFDNATAFSPPESLVRIGGRRVDNGYLVRIDDSGVGIGEHRIEELNDLLKHPPIIGLSVEPTLGMSVVSLLANKHDIAVTLTTKAPGLTVDVLLPASVLAEEPAPAVMPPADVSIEATFASALGMAPAMVNGHHGAAAVEEEAVLARLEADWDVEVAEAPAAPAAPAPVDPGLYEPPTAPEAPALPEPGLTARLTDAFERADLHGDSPEQLPMPTRGRDDAGRALGESTTNLPVRPGVGAFSGLQSFKSGLAAAKADLSEPPVVPTPVADQEPLAPGEWHSPDAEPPAPTLHAGIQNLRGAPAPEVSLAELASDTVVPDTPVDDDAQVTSPAAAFAAPAPGASAAPTLPPPASAPAGEFAIPPAPPISPFGPSGGPVAPDYATPAPRPTLVRPTIELPTRSRNEPAVSAVGQAASEDDGIAAALAAFDNVGLAPVEAPHFELPARNPGNEQHYTAGYRDGQPEDDIPESVNASPLAPDQLRARLRAFQSEFRTGQTTSQNNPATSEFGEDR